MNISPSYDLLKALVQSLPLNVFAKNTNGEFVYANENFCQYIGRSLRDILGKSDFNLHPENLAEQYRSDDRRIMLSGKMETVSEQYGSSGEMIALTVLKAPLYGGEQQDQLLGTVGIFWDGSEERQGALALAEERNLLRTVIDTLPDFIYVKDLESRFVVANSAVSRVMGASDPVELIGQSDFDYYPKEEAQEFRKDELQVITSESPIREKEECHHDSEGKKVWTLTNKLPLRNIYGEIIGTIGTGKDITEYKENELYRERLEAQLRQSQKMETIGTLTAGIAHDFNNLLNVINGYSELMTLSMSPNDPKYEKLQKILQAGRSAAELINQLMAFSRKQVIQPKLLNFNSLLTNTQRLLRRVLGEKVEIQLQLDEELWFCYVDPNQMDQIIVNLAANARDAMPDGGLLILKTSNVVLGENAEDQERLLDLPGGEYIKFSVIDNGYGISTEIKERVFEPFFTTKELHKGTGLGLSMIFGIVQQNKGAIQLESEENKGAAFHIYLPRSTRKEVGTELKEKKSLPRGSENILVVEDEKNVQNFIFDLLQSLGYSVNRAANGLEALEFVSQSSQKVDLLLTDVIMPELGGKELADRVVQILPDIKIVFMSGYTDDVIDHISLDRQGAAFLQKPVTPMILAVKLRDLLDGGKK